MRATTPQQDFIRGIWNENPVLVQLLGLCPALAVTNTVLNSVAMSGATLFVLLGSSLFISTLKKVIPHEVRISTYILIIATFVTVVDMALHAHGAGGLQGDRELHPPHRGELHDPGAAGGLRLQAPGGPGFAGCPGDRRRVHHRHAHDGDLQGGGGERDAVPGHPLRAFNLFGPNYEPWVVMISPPGGFFTLGFILLFLGWWETRKAQKKEIRHWPHSVRVTSGKEAA